MTFRFRGVAFDLDGLLLDSEPVFQQAARKLLAKRGVAFDETFLPRIMGMPGRDSLPLFKSHFELTDSVEDIGADYKNYFMESMNGQLIPLRPGARSMIDCFHGAQIPFVLATSSRRVFVDSVFGPHGMIERFRHILTADDVINGKPHPEMYQLAASKLGICVSELLVFEDSATGVQAAKAAGCVCVAVPQAHTPRDRVAIADLIVESLEDFGLLEWLTRQK